MGRKLSLIERTMVFIVSFVAVLYFMSLFRFWQLDFQGYLIRSERWVELIFVFAVAMGVSFILTRLLQWEYRVEAKIKRKR